MTKRMAYHLKHASVYIGVAGYVAMIVTGNFIVGAWSKMIAEMLRLPFYRHTGADDMANMSIFFIVVSIIAIVWSFL